MGRLTKPQFEFLGEMIERGSVGANDDYKPAVALVDAGFATKTEQRLSQPIFSPTDAGKQHWQDEMKKRRWA